jgi:dipeptidyl aminopeptidase/acylaminoacyl peptidase
VILYGKGYRFGFNGKPSFFGTGILELSSSPEGAAVSIDGELTTATNNSINLEPGTYDVRIFQDGYMPWEKKITIKKEVVAKADVRLFPKAPTAESITNTGLTNPVIDPSLTKIAFVASPAATTDSKKNGVFILDMTSHPLLTLQSNLTQIADDTTDAFSTSLLSWSPDGKTLLATISAATNRTSPSTYSLDATSFNQTPQNVTETLTAVMDTWSKEKSEKQTAQLNTLAPLLRNFVADNFSIIAWSPTPNETKILYQASTSATLPAIIIPPHIGTDNTPEQRTLQKGAIYVYDTKDDQNFQILDAQTTQHELENGQTPIQWLPDSAHLIYTHDKKIDLMDYDGLNATTIWAGPFVDHFVFPWPDGSKLVILTNFNNNQILPNLYTISLK